MALRATSCTPRPCSTYPQGVEVSRPLDRLCTVVFMVVDILPSDVEVGGSFRTLVRSDFFLDPRWDSQSSPESRLLSTLVLTKKS